MSFDLIQRPRGRTLDRRLVRDLDRIAAEHALARAEMAAAAGRVDLGMRAVAHISAVERQLAEEVPEAAPRLHLIADMGTAAIARIVVGADD